MTFSFSPEINNFFMRLAYKMRDYSHGRNTKVGCVIIDKSKQILSVGANRYPDGVVHIHTKPEKYARIAHAEEMALALAGKNGVSTRDCIAYVTMTPCAMCTRNLIIHGLSEIIFAPSPAEYNGEYKNCTDTYDLMNESGIKYKEIIFEPKSYGGGAPQGQKNLLIAHGILMKKEYNDLEYLIRENAMENLIKKYQSEQAFRL